MYYASLRRRAKQYKAVRKATAAQNVAIEAKIAPVYLPLHDDVKNGLHLTYCLPGGRGSGKSSFISLEIIDGLKNDPEANAIIFRRTGNTLRDSCFSQIAWAISELGQDGLWRGSVSPMQYVNVKTGQQILFRGLDDAQKLKSVKPKKGRFKYLWIEEFSELQGPNTVRSVNQSIIRGGKDFRIFYSFNPPRSRNNWANLYAVQLQDNALTFRTDYTQMPPEWLGETFILEAEALKSINEDAYRHEYLGEATGTGGEVFPHVEAREITDDEISGMQFIYQGLDWGFSTDPMAFVRLSYDAKKRTLYLIDEIVKRGCSNEETAAMIKEKGYDTEASFYVSPFSGATSMNKARVICDSAEPKSIQDLRNAGIMAAACQKYAGSVLYGVKWLQSKRIVIDQRRTPVAFKEFTGYTYQMTKDGEYTTDLIDADNHCIDAVRYACDLLINSGRNSA